ncbi:CAP domain-containing protein [Calycomorphotria hydatis]|uniref:Cysteine-rich secretory protein family protein n=1 Tax=Calycomorphotria hydatis TaxID=2528027 RepID=A0A517TF93_9PLAN|nr:CAP domain-containing protein [Calycomorphotria hydatis]QDT67046.1 Cysteine-rich secretory protein family protein [Calycomorphotria hydatis]
MTMLHNDKRFVSLAIIGIALCACSFANAAEKNQKVPETDGELPSAVQPDLEKAVSRIIERTNQFRKEHDREAVTPDDLLTKAAESFAAFMARTDLYGHQADGKEPHERIAEAGYEYCTTAENIALVFRSKGFKTEELVDGFVDGWIESKGHRKNMLDTASTETGVAIRKSEESGKYYAVQLFGRPQSAALAFQVWNKTSEPIQVKWGERSFDINPGVGYSFRMCRPAEVKFYQSSSNPDQKFKTEPFATANEIENKKFSVVEEAGAIGLKVEDIEGTKE